MKNSGKKGKAEKMTKWQKTEKNGEK